MTKLEIKTIEGLIKKPKNYTLSTSDGDMKFMVNGSKLNIIFNKKMINVMKDIIDICDDLELSVDDKYVNNNIIITVTK